MIIVIKEEEIFMKGKNMKKFEKSLELLKHESHLIGGWSGTVLGGGAIAKELRT